MEKSSFDDIGSIYHPSSLRSSSFTAPPSFQPTRMQFSCRLNEDYILLLPKPSSKLHKPNYSISKDSNFLFPLLTNADKTLRSQIELRLEVLFRDINDEWQLFQRTEFSNLKDGSFSEWLIPIELRPNYDYRFEIKNSNDLAIGFMECSNSQIISQTHSQEVMITNLYVPENLKLKSFGPGDIIGDLFIQFHSVSKEASFCLPIKPLPYLNQYYHVPTKDHQMFFIQDSLITSPYSFLCALALSKSFYESEAQIIQTIRDLHFQPSKDFICKSLTPLQSSFDESHFQFLKEKQLMAHLELKKYYKDINEKIQQKFEQSEIFGLRKSTEKMDLDLQWVTLNLHIQQMMIWESEKQVGILQEVTFGAPSAHAYQNEMKSNIYSPSGLLSSSTISHTNYLAFKQNRQSVLLEDLKQQLILYQQDFDQLREEIQLKLEKLIQLPSHVEKERRSFMFRQLDQECNQLKHKVVSVVHECIQLIQECFQISSLTDSSLLEDLKTDSIVSILSNIKTSALMEIEGLGFLEQMTSLSDQIHNVSYQINLLLQRTMSVLERICLLADYESMKEHQNLILMRQRRDANLSQILGAAVTSFLGLIMNYFKQKELNRKKKEMFWKNLVSLGFLLQFESLLSPNGVELKMLKDFKMAVKDLEMVQFTFHAFDGHVSKFNWLMEDLKIKPEIGHWSNWVKIQGGRSSGFLVSLALPSSIYETLPKEIKSGEQTIPLFPVLIGQGLNEQQILANWKSEPKRFQQQMNREGTLRLIVYMERLKKYYVEQCCQLGLKYPDLWIHLLFGILEELKVLVGLDNIEDNMTHDSIASLFPSYKRPSMTSSIKNDCTLLMLVSHFMRLLTQVQPDCLLDGASVPPEGLIFPVTPTASRLISCKSAKDRSSMSVTLDQTLFLAYRGQFHSETLQFEPSTGYSIDSLHPDYFHALLMTMRGEEGVRLANVEMNLGLGVENGLKRGDGKFAFHSLQLNVFPDLYRPPLRCIQSSLST